MNKNIKTFKEWSNNGYLIIKGSKNVGKNKDGEYLFTRDQVQAKPDLGLNFKGSRYWDNATDENCCGGPMYGIYGNCD